MSLRPPSNNTGASVSDVLFDALGHEILAEKASVLGRAGARAALCVARLNACRQADAPPESRDRNAVLHDGLLREACDAVYAWFIQRELCGLRRHDAIIRDVGIPREVLVRLGAK